MNEIRNERGEITTDNKEIQRILSKYYEPLYANKLDKMNKFLKALIFICFKLYFDIFFDLVVDPLFHNMLFSFQSLCVFFSDLLVIDFLVS